jgi:peptidoglycan/xylan/chitin deacetylase (PgdA/CDA1 family)
MFRFDRLITLGMVAPSIRLLRTIGQRETIPKIPILMYHSITDDPEPGVSPYFRLNTPPAVFRAHLQVLRDEGYTTLTLGDAIEWMEARSNGSKNSENPVTAPARIAVITFDDGFLDNLSNALPVLEEFGFTADIYLPTAYIGDQRRTFKGRECLTWSEVREMRARGIRFGSHTTNHPVLKELPWQRIEIELRDSRRHLEDELQEEITSFSHPYAFPQEDRVYTNRLSELLGQTGYRDCVTTLIGRNASDGNRYRLKRLPVNSSDDAALFGAKIQGAYDWVALAQGAVKRLKGWSRGNSRS